MTNSRSDQHSYNASPRWPTIPVLRSRAPSSDVWFEAGTSGIMNLVYLSMGAGRYIKVPCIRVYIRNGSWSTTENNFFSL